MRFLEDACVRSGNQSRTTKAMAASADSPRPLAEWRVPFVHSLVSSMGLTHTTPLESVHVRSPPPRPRPRPPRLLSSRTFALLRHFDAGSPH